MKRILVTLTVCATLAAVVSCEYDSPEIRFQQTTTITNDYSKVIDALRDQTLTISQKMDLLADAMKNQTLTLSEKMSLLEEALKNQTLTLSEKMDLMTKAYENGVLKYEELTGKLISEIKAANTGMAEKLDAIKRAVEAQTTDLHSKMDFIGKALDLIADTAEKGFDKNAEASGLVKAAIESLKGSMEKKLDAINDAIASQSATLSDKLTLIKGAVDAGLVGENSTLGLVKKAIDALNSTAGTANEKLDAIKEAITSPSSGLNVKLEAIKEAVEQGLVDVTAKQDLILAAINSSSSYSFTKDELLEVGNDYLLVDEAFWNANHQNYEMVRALKDLIPLSLPTKYKFYFKQESGKYPLSGYEDTSFYGPLYEEGKILRVIQSSSELILAVNLQTESNDPNLISKNGHSCYFLKKVYRSCRYVFHVGIGGHATNKKLKMENMGSKDNFAVESEYIEYGFWSEAVATKLGVWGFSDLAYDPSGTSPTDHSKEFIIIEDK